MLGNKVIPSTTSTTEITTTKATPLFGLFQAIVWAVSIAVAVLVALGMVNIL